jgi:predicted ferric reductase
VPATNTMFLPPGAANNNMAVKMLRRNDSSDNVSVSFASLPFSSGLNGVDQTGNYLYVHITLGLFALAAGLTIGLRIFQQWTAFMRQISSLNSPAAQAYWAKDRLSWFPALKKHLLYAPLWKQRHNKELRLSSAANMGTLPGRGHFVLLLFYTLANIAWTAALPYNKPRESLLAALRGRAGVLAVFNLFPTIVFALRNNPLIHLLEIPFDTFNLFHRWTARIFVLEALIHLCAWAVDTALAGGVQAVSDGLSHGSHAASYTWGLVAAIAGFIIIFQAWSPIRHAFYEVFIVLHKLLVFVVFLGVYYHLKIDHLMQLWWMRIIWALWGYDYLCRLYRIIRYNVDFSKRQFASEVTVEALREGACRVTFTLARTWEAKPGCHVHAYLPALAPMQGHPFSVAWARNDDIESSHMLSADKMQPSTSDILERRSRQTTKVSLLVRARTGFTRRLYDMAKVAPNRTISTWGYCEGFYGGLDSLDSYKTVFLFAGGVGITHQMMNLKNLLEGHSSGTNCVRSINLVWSISTAECFDWVRGWMDEILRMKGRREAVKIHLYVTNPVRPGQQLHSPSGSVVMIGGRCDPQKLIDEAVISNAGPMAVTVCGPGAFADVVRDAVRKRVNHTVVDFIEEAFTY